MDKFNFNKVANETALVEFLIEIVLHISHLVLDRLPVIKSRLYFGNFTITQYYNLIIPP